MRLILELLRIILIFGLLGGIIWAFIENIYTINETVQGYSWLGGVAILLLLFVYYRNKLQFTGWYKGKDKSKLPKKVSLSLIIVSILLFGSPFLLGTVLG